MAKRLRNTVFSVQPDFRILLLRLLVLSFLPEIAVAFAPLNSDSIISGIRIRVKNLNRQDEAFLDLTPGHDTVAVSKLDNPGITLALGTAFNRYSIAGRATVEEAGIIPFDLRRPGSLNTMTILKTGPETSFYAIFLKDDAEGTINLLSADSTEFEFSATGNDQTRFSLLIQSSATGIEPESHSTSLSCPPPMAESFCLKDPESGFVSFIDLGGRTFSQPYSKGKNPIVLSGLPAGIYRMACSDSRKTCLIIRK